MSASGVTTTLGMGVRRAADRHKKGSAPRGPLHDSPQTPKDLRSGSRSDGVLEASSSATVLDGPETGAATGAGKADSTSSFDAGPSAYIPIESLPRPIGEPMQ